MSDPQDPEVKPEGELTDEQAGEVSGGRMR
jgi:hypothetical protein